MIVSIKHKGLRLFWEQGDPSKLPQAYLKRIDETLDLLHRVHDLHEIRQLRTYRLHALSGKLRNYWAVTVSGNDRIIFRFENQDVYLLDYLDYH